MQRWIVHKFGGTSVGSAEKYKAVARILSAASSQNSDQGVIVSAMSGVTNALIELTELARRQSESYRQKLQDLQRKHLTTAAELLPAGEMLASLQERIKLDIENLAEILRGIWLARSCSERVLELVSGYGELWSAQLLNAYLQSTGIPSAWMDARQVLIVHPSENNVAVQYDRSQDLLTQWLDKNCVGTNRFLVITGFIASTPDGIATTLKRNGSDFSASIFGSLLNASSITIWTDVDGVMSADPRLVPDAFVLDELSYHEATELAYFGAKVVHPSTMAPAIQKKIPIWIRNTSNPAQPGTKIHDQATSSRIVKGFATIDGMALLNLEGTGMIGVPGIAQRLFGALKEVGVSVTMISQASSEHSICFAVTAKQAELAKSSVERVFYAEFHQGQIQSIEIAQGCSVLAVVGDNMAHRSGVAGKFLSALGNAGINVRAIAQGSSERNISVVIDEAQSQRGLQAVHSAFCLSNQTLSVGIIGPGLIGKTLLGQLHSSLKRLREERRIDIRIRGIANSKSMLLEDRQVDLSKWASQMKTQAIPLNLAKFADHIQATHLPHAAIIDTTASEEISKVYPEWLKRGIHVITPNKKANAGDLSFYRDLRKTARESSGYYLYSTTVGAGLPVIQTLKDFIQTGDEVFEIEGIFSGTLSYIFNSFDGKRTFSEAVLEAKDKGYTEPDPREDLSGMDVARKLIILAREMGMSLELPDVEVQSLVPEALRGASLDRFLSELPNHDLDFQERFLRAESKNEVLRYVGEIRPRGKSRVSLSSYPKDHPFSQVSGSDNMIAFKTSRYSNHPLIIQGPGAGPEVTAGGVFADLLRLASYLGAPL